MATTYNDIYAMPETGLWTAQIYQIEVTDQARGYNAETDTDGPANIQWQQLADRTRFLKNFVEISHTPDGHHILRDADFIAGTQIPESYLALAHSTKDIAIAVEQLYDTIEKRREDLTKGENLGDLALGLSMQRIIPLSWKYSGNVYAFDLFTDSLTLRTSNTYTVTATFAGDRSIDVVDSTGITKGQSFILTDQSNPENYSVVRIADVLTKRRVILEDKCAFTTSLGKLQSTNANVGEFVAHADKSFYYISDYYDGYEGMSNAQLRIRHTPETDCNVIVDYSTFSELVWIPIELSKREENETYQDDIFELPDHLDRCRFRIRYLSLSKPTDFTSVLIAAEIPQVWIEEVYCPTIESATRIDKKLYIQGSWYGSLYDITQGSLMVQVSEYKDFSSNTKEFHVPGERTNAVINYEDEAGYRYVRIAYEDVEGVQSRWSEPVFIIEV